MKRWQYLAPLALFAVLLGFLAVGLNLNPREVPSPLIGKPVPAFELTRLDDPALKITHADLKGQVWILNVWASWCVACREEHPVLLAYTQSPGSVPIIGLNYKDKRNDGQLWLARHGNPYLLSVFDPDGRIGLDYGVYGVPETYLIDKAGYIRHKHNGPVTTAVMEKTLLPLIRELNR